jgi:hypothetical protein
LGQIYWGTAAATPPINLESDIGLPQYHLIEEVVLGTAEDALRPSLRFMMKNKLTLARFLCSKGV